jgi:hypothetical protein
MPGIYKSGNLIADPVVPPGFNHPDKSADIVQGERFGYVFEEIIEGVFLVDGHHHKYAPKSGI